MAWTLVTGAAKRLGAEICGQLAAKGHSIVVHYNTSRIEAESAVNGLRKMGVQAESIQGDFSTIPGTQDFIERYLERFPKTKFLVNNVGNYLVKKASETNSEEWLDLFQTNLNAPAAISNALLPSLIQEKGSIVNIGVSGLTSARADTYCPAYTSSKMGLLLLTKSLAKQLAPKHVRVNMVSPGLLENAVDMPKDLTIVPMHRAGTLEEVAQVVCFLFEPENSYITGQNIEISGGLRL